MFRIRNKAYVIVVMMMTIVFFHRFFIQLGISGAVKYILDILNVMLFLLSIKKNKYINQYQKFSIILCIFLVVLGTLGTIRSHDIWNVKILNYIFDIRGIIRPIIFVNSIVVTLKYWEIQKIKSYLVIYNLINFIYITYQYFTLEVPIFWMRGDNLNGFFGIETGGNVFVNALLIATTVIAIDSWMKKDYSLRYMIIILGVNLITAVLIELKIFFVEFGIILFILLLPKLKKINKNKIIILTISFIFVPILFNIMINMLYRLYPSMEGTLSFQGIISATTTGGYSNKNDINRLSFIQGINRNIFGDDMFLRFFGVGLGTANLNGSFAMIYETTHYTWFSAAYTYVETGIIGLTLFTVFLLSPAFMCVKGNKNIGICCAIMAILLQVYNETYKTEASYIVFFLTASAFVRNDTICFRRKYEKK